MKSGVDLDWMLQRYYTHPDNPGKKELLKKLRDLWGNSTRDEIDEQGERGERSDIPLTNLRYAALNKLYAEYQEDFMMILLMTMRVRVMTTKEGREVDLEKKLDLSGPGLNGLRALLKHWRKQQNDASELDVVCEFISSRQELRKPEYIVGALVEQVRRIRRGWKPGEDTHLEISDGLLHLAKLHLAKLSVDTIPKGSEVDDYNVVPNEQLELFVEFQKILNQGKRPITARDLNSRLEKFLEKLKDADEFFTKDIYRWWAYYSLLRNSRRCMMPDEASDYEVDLGGVRKKMSAEKQEWADNLRITGSVLRGITEEMKPIGEYHQGLAEFLNGERKLRTCAAPLGRRDMRDYKLYSTIVGRKMRKDVRLFVNTKTIPLKKKEYGNSKNSSCLIDYLGNSITNADLASHSVISRSHLLAPVMLVLLATDLVVRFRWFAAPVQAAVFDDKYPGRINKSENHKEAVRLKKELIGVLKNIQIRLNSVLPPVPAKSPSPVPIQLIEGWISALEKLDLKETENFEVGWKVKQPEDKPKNMVKLTALGQLSNACGKFVGWPWSHPWQVKRVSRRMITNDPNNLELYVPQQNEREPLVIISVENEGDYANYFTYVKPVKGSLS